MCTIALMAKPNRTCECGAVYERTESIVPRREIDSFQCVVCNATLETWNTAWVPVYRFVAGPVQPPDKGTTDDPQN
jgi:hypothetical protein